MIAHIAPQIDNEEVKPLADIRAATLKWFRDRHAECDDTGYAFRESSDGAPSQGNGL